MSESNDVIRGVLKIDNLPDTECFTSWSDFLKRLPYLLSVELPASVTNVNVGSSQPTDDERDNLWVRKDNSGSFLGLFIYAQGSWRQIFPAQNSPILMLGDSRVIPSGYTLASDVTFVTTDQLTALKRLWVVGGTSPEWFTMFHVFYTGF